MQELKDLKKGDVVIQYDEDNVPRRRVVEKVLKKVVIVDGLRYWISSALQNM